MITQRFNENPAWKNPEFPLNNSFRGLVDLAYDVGEALQRRFGKTTNLNMIEIGSFMGESTQIFAASHVFKQIVAVDPLDGHEEFNDLFGYDWDMIRNEFKINTRYFDNIHLFREYSYNFVKNVDDESQHFIYIDGDHSYESVKNDIEMYLPKLVSGGIIAGHDFVDEHPGTVKAVVDVLGKPDMIYKDTSWAKVKL